MSEFIGAIELNKAFFDEIIRPILDAELPALQYSAALIGPGSEVYGFDTEMSMDHDWGLKCFIFVGDDIKDKCDAIYSTLGQNMPTSFRGYPTAIETITTTSTTRTMENDKGQAVVRHHVSVLTLTDFCQRQLGYDAVLAPLEPKQWLSIPSHALRELVAGAVFHDVTGDLTRLRSELATYPEDVYWYLVAAGWQRIGQEEHLMPRAGYAGSELGASIIASRLVRDVMNLCFLIERQYAPYAKWFGTGFSKLDCAQVMEPLLLAVQSAASWKERHESLVQAYEHLAELQNRQLPSDSKVQAKATPFHTRPWVVIQGEEIAQVLLRQIKDVEMRRLASRPVIGALHQWSDNTDMEKVSKAAIVGLYGTEADV